MEKILRKGFLIGLGITSLTKNKIESSLKSLIREKKISEKQARLFLKRALEEGKRQKRKLDNLIDEETKRNLQKMRDITRKEAQKLAKKVLSLESQLKKKAKRKRRVKRRSAKRAKRRKRR